MYFQQIWLELVRSVWFGLVQFSLTSEDKYERKVPNFFISITSKIK
jgi:hypothetical protein